MKIMFRIQKRFFGYLIIILSFSCLLTLTQTACNMENQVPGSEIESTTPEQGEIDVSPDTDISITFNKPALPQTLSLVINPYIEYERSWSPDNTTIVITPAENLLPSATYLVTIAAVKFSDNSSLVQPVSFSFDTVVDENNPPAPLAMSDENIETVESINEDIDRGIKKGLDAETICTQIVEMLQDNENISSSGIDEDNNAVWVNFNDGELQVFQVITDDTEEYDSENPVTTERSNLYLNRSGEPLRHSMPEGSEDIPHYLPANNRALLANALQIFHPDKYVNNSTDTVKEMLTDRGYEVTMHPLVLDDFNKLGDYGVILIETHGTWRPLAAYNAAIDALSTQHILLTTTRITSENIPPDWQDIKKDKTKLVSWTVKNSVMTVNGVKIVSTLRNYGVTAEYVREKVQTFTDKTIFFLNACKGISDETGETASPFKDLLFEKCDKGPVFIAWNNKTSFLHAVYASLNLFQYATASNKDVTVFGRDKSSGKMVAINLLKSLVVPWGGYNMTVQAAYHELKTNGVIKDNKFGGVLQIETKGTDTYENILMPHPRYVEFDADGNHQIDMLADTNPEVTVGDTKCTVTRKSRDSCFWSIKMPVGAYGKLVVTENGRTSIPRTVYKWNPKIKVQSDYTNSDGSKHTTANLSLYARATLSRTSLRDYPGDEMPTAGFTTVWEKAASSISWNSNGNFSTVDPYFGGTSQTTWADSGLRYLGDRDDGDMDYDKSVGLDISCSTVIPIKIEQTTSLGTFKSDDEIDISFSGFYKPSSVTSEWTVSGQSFDNLQDWPSGIGGITASEIVSWQAFSPDPLFDSSSEPR